VLGLLHRSPAGGVSLAATPLPRLGASLQVLHLHSPRSHANPGCLLAGARRRRSLGLEFTSSGFHFGTPPGCGRCMACTG